MSEPDVSSASRKRRRSAEIDQSSLTPEEGTASVSPESLNPSNPSTSEELPLILDDSVAVPSSDTGNVSHLDRGDDEASATAEGSEVSEAPETPTESAPVGKSKRIKGRKLKRRFLLQGRGKSEGAADNDSTCFECKGGGELLCCDSCTNSFHAACLTDAHRPMSQLEDWYCPQCRDRDMTIAVRRGIPSDFMAEYRRGLVVKEEGGAVGKDVIEPEVDEDHVRGSPRSRSPTPEARGPRRSTRRVVIVSHPSSSPPIMGRGGRRRNDEGPASSSAKINVGPLYQVPAIPCLFLEASEYGVSYTDGPKSSRVARSAGECRLMYSPYAWNRAVQRAKSEGVNGNVVQDSDELRMFVQRLEQEWPPYMPVPFDPEYAFKILHFSNYDAANALMFLRDGHIDVSSICDPPTRPYMNKWRPKDKRGAMPTAAPFPPFHKKPCV